MFVCVSHLDGDDEGDEGSIKGENSRVSAQWSEFPPLQREVDVRLLHQHESMEGVHFEGDVVLLLAVGHVGDSVRPPLLI